MISLKNKRKCYQVLFTILLSFSLIPCSQASLTQSIQAYVKEVYARPAVPIENIPSVTKPEHYKYSAYTLRSPFEAAQPRMLAGANKLLPDAHRKKEVLEAFPLDALHFVGMISEGHTPWALIMAPDSTIYRVRVGNYIGQDYGKIVAIADNTLTLQEVIADSMGGWRNKERLLSLLDQPTG